ncbi:MAG: hypothetical protein WC889_02880 [Myxococcota bacterium]|jgi:hypothetical protein
MTPPATWALADTGSSIVPWTPGLAKRELERAGVDQRQLLAELVEGNRPATPDWLQKRLRLLWKSSTPAGSLDATAWLHETGRLLADLPQDILAAAIDTAVMQSARGFMPSVGEIRAIAEPHARTRRLQEDRLRAAIDWTPPVPVPVEPTCTPEEAAAILAEEGIKLAERPLQAQPTLADYIELGLTEDEARDILAKQKRELAKTMTVGKALAA